MEKGVRIAVDLPDSGGICLSIIQEMGGSHLKGPTVLINTLAEAAMESKVLG